MEQGPEDGGSSKLRKSVVSHTGRHFFDAPATLTIDDCVVRLTTLEGIDVVSLMPAELGHWLVFRLEGYSFSASNPLGEVWFYADDPATPEAVLQKIALCIVGPTKAA